MVDQISASKARAKSTILGSVEPMGDDERKALLAEQRKRWCVWALDCILFEAISDIVLGTTVCEKVGRFAQNDAGLVAALLDSSTRKSRGRPEKWNLETYRILLIHYAWYVQDANGNVDAAIDNLIEYHQRMYGSRATFKAMSNNVSKAIGALTKANQLESLFEEIEWVRDPIRARIDSRIAKKKID